MEKKYILLVYYYIDGNDFEERLIESDTMAVICDKITSYTHIAEDTLEKFYEQESSTYDNIRHDNCYYRFEIYPSKIK